MDDRDLRRRHDLPDRESLDPEERGSDPPPAWQLWVSFLGAPVLWLVHFLLFYLAVEQFCAFGGEEALGRWMLITGTGVAVLAALGLAFVAWRVGRRATRNSYGYDDFLPRVGVISALTVAFVLTLEGLPLLFVGICR